ncbi:tetratricopeptide repeat protein [Sporolactobacillus laevolacticus]|uniref:Sel1 repeat family protein n=1 Tax=Sporolactobacillus laevolacticus DSM 442 TaxID=1395513 RepID=V6IW83_9BACL|nr:SEL1-like repeat protein [Sporolactobacillus laevolacticus]EST11497.1 hypothetical protein P343_11740 [Sporolactobacillus laevolacticus DSM 442]
MENLVSPILVDLVSGEDDSKLILDLQFAEELANRKLRRHRVISVQFYQEPGKRPLRVQDHAESTEFQNEVGELDYAIPLRKDKMTLAIPYTVFPQFKYGDLVSARVSLEDTVTGEVLSHELLNFFATQTGKLDFFSNQYMLTYLKSDLPAEVRLEKMTYWMDKNEDNAKVLSMSIEFLKELAEAGSQDAVKKLCDIYGNERYSVSDKNEAEKWASRLEQKVAQRPAVPMEQKESSEEDLPKQITNEAALKKCEQLAKDGSAEARWLIYAYSCSPEGTSYSRTQAFSYLRLAAEDGLERAVRALANACEKSFVFISKEQVAEYIAILKKASEKKQPLADYLLFQIYNSGTCLGQPIPGNKKIAYSMLLAAAENGSMEASYDLWNYYEHGNEFLMEREDALKWLIVAADKGLAAAESRLGDLYIDGKYVEKNNQKGLSYLNKAAEKNNWDAQMKQYEAYYEGRYKDILFEKNKEKAFHLLRSFANSGNPKACILIMDKYEHGNEMVMEHKQAVYYLKVAAKNGYAQAMYQLANVLLDGVYLPQDLGEAKRLLNSAAVNGYPDAQFALYHYYRSGYKTLKNKRVNQERALQWLYKAAGTLPSAQYEIWLLCQEKEQTDLDLTDQAALDYLFRSASQKFGPALYRVGMAFGSGVEVEKNPERGLSLIEEAASMHHPEAIYELSQIRMSGTFGGVEVTKDESEGLHPLILSAELGYPTACKQIGEWFAKGLLPDESEAWIKQTVDIAVNAGLTVKMESSPQSDMEAAIVAEK